MKHKATSEFSNRYKMIGRNLITYRTAMGMTQDDVADASGISRSTLSLIESGKTSFSSDTLFKICRTIQVEPEIIFHYEPLKPPGFKE